MNQIFSISPVTANFVSILSLSLLVGLIFYVFGRLFRANPYASVVAGLNIFWCLFTAYYITQLDIDMVIVMVLLILLLITLASIGAEYQKYLWSHHKVVAEKPDELSAGRSD